MAQPWGRTLTASPLGPETQHPEILAPSKKNPAVPDKVYTSPSSHFTAARWVRTSPLNR